MNDTTKTAAAEADTANQNQAAANSTGPLDAAAGSQSGEGSGALLDASAVEGSPTQGTSDVGNALAAVNSAAENSGAQDQAAGTKAANEDALLGQLSDAVQKDMLAKPTGDVSSERAMLAAIRGFKEAFKVKYDHLLTGMATSTAEALRCLADAEIHLADHIAQQDTPKVGE